MGHWSDQYHADICAWRFCNAMMNRADMKRVKGKRGWFCPRHYELLTPKKVTKKPGQGDEPKLFK